jgi:glycosyltransferase involved in cell wall biosynthesis
MIDILYISNKNEIFLNGYLNSLNKKLYNIYILDLKHGIYIDLSKGETKQILKISLKQSRFTKYCLRYICAFLFITCNTKKKYDVCHILNIKRENFWIIPYLKKRSKRLIVTVYGRSTYTYFSKRVLFLFVYKYVDKLVFSNQSLIDEFLFIYKKFDKTKIIRIIPPIVNIAEKDNGFNSEAFFNTYKIRKDLIRISCSSTIASYDQHDKIIESVSRIKNKNKVQLLFLLTYGGTTVEKEKTIRKIKSELRDFNVLIFDSFLSNNELSAYRAATDIYINMRTSDQLAGAIIESLYNGALLISGEWLNYGTFDDIGIYYKKVKDFEELTNCVDDSIANFSDFKKNNRIQNIEKTAKEFSVDVVMGKWNNIYQH